MNATIDGNAQILQGELVSGNYFEQLQVQPQLDLRRRADGLQHGPDRAWRGGADGVRKHHDLAARVLERPRVLSHPRGRHLALEWAPERRREDADGPATLRPRGLGPQDGITSAACDDAERVQLHA